MWVLQQLNVQLSICMCKLKFLLNNVYFGKSNPFGDDLGNRMEVVSFLFDFELVLTSVIIDIIS